MVSYPYVAPSGVPGDVTRTDESNVEPSMLIAPYPSNFGLPMKYASGSDGFATGVTPMVAGDTASLFCGSLARAVPGISGNNTNEMFDTFEPNPNEPTGLLVRGYQSVICSFGTPVRGQLVYVCVVAEAGHVVGAYEAGSNAYNVALTGTEVGNVTWATDGLDAAGNAEIRIAQ